MENVYFFRKKVRRWLLNSKYLDKILVKGKLISGINHIYNNGNDERTVRISHCSSLINSHIERHRSKRKIRIFNFFEKKLKFEGDI